MKGAGQAWRLLVRRFTLPAAAWMLPLWALTAQLAGAYDRVYPSPAERSAFLEQMQNSPGTKILYGQLREPGTLGQLFQWEGAPYLLLGMSLMAIFMTTKAMRGDEDSGLVELARGSGAGKWVALVTPMGWVMSLVALTGAVTGLLLTYQASVFDELTVTGGWVFAGLVTAVGWVWVALSALACQLARHLAGARSLALSLLAITFCLRILTDYTTHTWLRWISPQAWRDIVQPYAANRLWPLVLFAVASAALLGLVARLDARRELYDAYLPARPGANRRWHVREVADLHARLGRRQLVGWAATIVVFSAILGASSSSMTNIVQNSQGSREMMSQIAPGVDVVATLFSFVTLYTGTCILVAAVQAALALVGDERRGLVELQLAGGVRRLSLIATRAGWACLTAVVLTVTSAAVMAAMTQVQITSNHAVERSFVMTVTRLPGIFAAVGLAIAVVGLAPRLASLMWGVVAFSALAAMLGGLLNLPDWLMDISLLNHEVDPAGTANYTPLLVFTCVGLAGIAAGIWGFARRNVPSV